MDDESAPKEPTVHGRFAKVACADCGNEQVVFARAATSVTCQVCGSGLAEPSGGIAYFKGTVKGYVD